MIVSQSTVAEQLDEIARQLDGFVYRVGDERELHDGLLAAFQRLNMRVAHEVRLDRFSRIDFTIGVGSPRIGVEVKTRGSVVAIAEQLIRYAHREDISGLLVITTRARHVGQFGDAFNGKPVKLYRPRSPGGL